TASWAWDSSTGETYRSALVGIEVGDGTLAERGRVSHLGEPGGTIGAPAPGSVGRTSPRPDDGWSAQIRRSVVVDDVLVTVSSTGVLASDLATLSPLGWAAFD